MKSPHRLRVTAEPSAFAPLVAAARAAGLRVGWLELTAPGPAPPGPTPPGPTPPHPTPSSLEAAAAAGVLRAVAVGEGRSVAVKPLAGPPVLRDLVREHFLGCALLLVRGEVEASLLTPDGDAWRLEPPGEPPRRLTTPELVARLRRPRPW